MQPGNPMAQPSMVPQQQYQMQQPQQPPQQYFQPQYQVQQPPAAGYYYQQPQQPAAQQYGASQQAQVSDDGVRSLWIGDLEVWMDEAYLYTCFTPGEVVNAKVIRNKQTSVSEKYGFIEFNSHATAERVLQTYNGATMPSIEKPFRMNWASMGAGEKRSDVPEYTVFVGDLAADVTDYLLQETFRAHYPSVRGAKVVQDRDTGRPKGYGFVRFADESEQIRAMTEMNGQFCSSRQMRVGAAANKPKMGIQTQGSYQTPSQGAPSEDDPSNTTIFVGNLDSSVSDEQLKHVFGQFGQLLHVKIPVGKRCGFVQFADRNSAEEALARLNGNALAGQSIRLSWGRSPSNKQTQSDPSQFSGGGGYYGVTPGYENYGYAAQAQDPNMYYGGGYPGYGNYPQQTQQQPPQ